MPALNPAKPRVVELFAGVGGFRIGLERSGWEVVWANQWEPTTTTQHAFDCYVARFQTGEHVCEDIHEVMNEAEAGRCDDPRPRAPGRRLPVPGLLGGQDAEPGRGHRGQEGRPLVGDPPAARR